MIPFHKAVYLPKATEYVEDCFTAGYQHAALDENKDSGGNNAMYEDVREVEQRLEMKENSRHETGKPVQKGYKHGSKRL